MGKKRWHLPPAPDSMLLKDPFLLVQGICPQFPQFGGIQSHNWKKYQWRFSGETVISCHNSQHILETFWGYVSTEKERKETTNIHKVLTSFQICTRTQRNRDLEMQSKCKHWSRTETLNILFSKIKLTCFRSMPNKWVEGTSGTDPIKLQVKKESFLEYNGSEKYWTHTHGIDV